MRHTVLAALALGLSSLCLAQAPAPKPLPPGIHMIEWGASGGAAALSTDIAPGKFAEWCGKLRAGEKVQWSFESAQALEMNVHYHEGREVHYPTRLDAARSGRGTLQVPVDQEYCWMWTNKSGKPAALKAALRKGA